MSLKQMEVEESCKRSCSKESKVSLEFHCKILYALLMETDGSLRLTVVVGGFLIQSASGYPSLSQKVF